jgi:hypothetical protein
LAAPKFFGQPQQVSLFVRRLSEAMAHDLSPKAGDSFLPQGEIIGRIVDAFQVHEVDSKKGNAIAEQMIVQLQRMNAPADLIDSYRRRQRFVLSIYISDDGSDDSYLSFTLWPNKRIFVGYHSRQHEDGSRVLLERLASILGYEITLV